MFSIQHFIWLAISIAGIAVTLRRLLSDKPSLQSVLTGACIISVASELIKIFSCIEMVPNADGTAMNMFLEWRHLPLHLCSIQILLIFYVRFSESERRRETFLAFMYPTCIIGATLALLMPSIFTTSVDVSQAFTHPLCYQFFVFHSMLVVLGVYIAYSGEVNIRFSHLYTTIAMMYVLGILSIYLNSAFAAVVYHGTQIVSVETTPNFFFTFRTPIGIALTQPWQWYLYIVIITVLVPVLITPFFLPYRTSRGPRRQRRKTR